MDFSTMIKKGPSLKAPRLLIVGVEGVGKSTFGAACQSPIFICAEDGLVGKGFAESKHFTPTNWEETLGFIAYLTDKKNQHGYKTVVIDTLDWMEQLVFQFICTRDSKIGVEDYGYGKGYVIACDAYRVFLAAVERLHRERDMMIVFCAHCQVKPFNNPAGDNYDRYELKLASKQIAGVTKEWCDAVLFARFEDMTYKESQKSRAKGVGTGKRIVHTNHCAAWDAKNRYGLPETLPLDADSILDAIAKGQPDSTASIVGEINMLIESLPEDKKKAAAEYVEKNKADVINLTKFLNRIRSMVPAPEPASAVVA